jgi:hypothetical protein
MSMGIGRGRSTVRGNAVGNEAYRAGDDLGSDRGQIDERGTVVLAFEHYFQQLSSRDLSVA